MRMRLPRRRRPVPDQSTGAHLLDHADHRHFMHPTDHVLPQGTVNRADELVWVATMIERHAAAGTLDEGNAHLLDAEIAARLLQWDHAVNLEAANRTRTAKALLAEESEHLVRLREQLADARANLARCRRENTHWRSQLLGYHVSSLAGATPDDVRRSASDEIQLADIGRATDTPWTRS